MLSRCLENSQEDLLYIENIRKKENKGNKLDTEEKTHLIFQITIIEGKQREHVKI